MSAFQKKKFEDKVEKYKKEVEITKNKYKQALDDLNSYNARYIEDMNVVRVLANVLDLSRPVANNKNSHFKGLQEMRPIRKEATGVLY